MKNEQTQDQRAPQPHLRKYDLEERTFQFARKAALYVKALPNNVVNLEYGKQSVKSSGSVGANYIEANEALSKKDFILRLKICRKEAKESAFWLRLILEVNGQDSRAEGEELLKEANELRSIFSAILKKVDY